MMTINTVNRWIYRLSFFTLAMLESFAALAFESSGALEKTLKEEISKTYDGAKVELLGTVQWVKGGLPSEIKSLHMLGDDSQGNIHFTVSSEEDQETSEGWMSFAAWLPARIAKRRILPGEALSADLFVIQSVNVSSGQAHEYRGLIFPEQMNLQGLETIQTIVEGQFLLTSAVQKTPDIHRGDSVRVQLVSGDLTLSTAGIAEEPGYFNHQIRIVTNKGKRELLGKLMASGVVEVRL